MPYMLLIVEPIGQRAARTETEGRQAYASMVDFAQNLRAQGKLLAVESLQSQDKAVRVAVRGGRTQTLDGPYAEAKEMVGGFFLIDVPTHEEALAIAARCPAAQWCEVEVRATAPCYE